MCPTFSYQLHCSCSRDVPVLFHALLTTRCLAILMLILHLEDYSTTRESSSITPYPDPLPRTLRESGDIKPPHRKHKSDLKPQERFYLDFQNKHMSHYHYGLNTDTRGFVHKFLIDAALSHDALLQAIISFAAYHHAIQSPDGKLQDFLKPYSEALRLLRQSLANGKPPDVGDLLTMLQLSALEVWSAVT